MQTHTASKSKSKEGKSAIKAFAIIFFTIVLLSLIGISAYGYYILNVDTFYPGVVVDGFALDGMSMDNAVKLIQEYRRPDLEKIKISLEHDGVRWEYDYESINAKIDVEEVIEEAYQVGRKGSFLDRIREIYRVDKYGQEFATTLTYDAYQLQDELEAIASEINLEPVDATITFNPDNQQMFTFTNESKGRGMLVEEAMENLKKQIDAGDFSAYNIPSQELNPQYTLEEVKTWTHKLTQFSSVVKGSWQRIHNVNLSSGSFHGLRLNPGEVFSMNETTGPRDKKSGYLDAPVIKEGKRLVNEPGGGNCQSSSTLYGAIVRADMEILERSGHSWPSNYVDPGQDAAVNYPTQDIKFKNNKDTPIFIRRTLKDIPGSEYKTLTIEVYGKKPTEYDSIGMSTTILSSTPVPPEQVVKDPAMYEGTEVIEYASRAYYKMQSYRIYYKDGKEIKKVPEALTVYPKIIGKKRVGTKPRPVQEPKTDPVDR